MGRSSLSPAEHKLIQRFKIVKVDYHQHAPQKSATQIPGRAVKSTSLSNDEELKKFESGVASYLKLETVVAVSSRSVALYLALIASGVSPGDEVITTPITPMSTVSTIISIGAQPVFVDINPFTGNIDTAGVEAAISPVTKVILPIHLYGVMCNMKHLSKLIAEHNITLVEDATHCIAGQREGILPGHLGDMACFSFDTLTSITCGKPACIATKDPVIAKRLKKLRLSMIEKPTAQHKDIKNFTWKDKGAGTLNKARAEILRTQFDSLEQYLKSRRIIALKYDEAFSSEPCIQTPRVPEQCRSAHHIYAIRVNPAKRNKIVTELKKREVDVCIHYDPVHLLPYFRTFNAKNTPRLPIAELFGKSVISLPSHPFMTSAMTDYVIENVKNMVHKHCPSSRKLSVVIAAYNEEKTIGSVIDRLQSLPVPTEIIISDDASTDKTMSVVKTFPKVRYLKMKHNAGRGPALLKGIKISTGEIVATFDADVEYFPEELPRLYNRLINSKAAALFGSRFAQPNPFLYMSYRWGNRILTEVCNLVWGLKLSDLETGVKLIRGNLARRMNIVTKGWDECPAIVAEIIRHGGTIEEQPICYSPRTFGEGKKIRPSAALSILWKIFHEKFIRKS